MPNVALYDITGKVIGDIELSENVFGQPVNEPVLHQVVVAHLANCRQGTQSSGRTAAWCSHRSPATTARRSTPRSVA